VLIGPQNVTGADFAAVSTGRDASLRACVLATLNSAGAARMRALSSQNIDRKLGIVFDGTLLTAPVIRSAIESELQLTGNFTDEDVDVMVAVLRSGTLPVPLKNEPKLVKKVDPQ
jgi:SecD/SecF fusion protein